MTEPVSLIRYEAAKAALAECVKVDEVLEIRDTADQVRAAARIAKDRTMQANAAMLVMRAERRLGVLIQSAHEIGQLGFGRPAKSNLTMSDLADKHAPESEGQENGQETRPLTRATLKEAGVDKYLSSRAQKWARMGEPEFDAKLEAERDRIESIGATPINGARTVMASRNEPGASLDYFPTPPWATRALLEDVLDGEVDGVVWEPACGEGHISGVLQEYGLTVLATDVHDYSVDGRSPPAWQRELDFINHTPWVLKTLARPHEVDWIITNPPFSGDTDRAMSFALQALDVAKRGVALFVRTQWLEGVERYEKLFGLNPPTVIAQFAERVPLVRGRWDPEASTASQYCWVVWIKDEHGSPCGFQWIRPGRRVERTKPDDVKRFMARPVISIRQDEPAEPVVEGTSALDDRPEYPSGESGTAREAPGSSVPSDGIADLSEGREHSSSGDPAVRSADPVPPQDGTQSAPPPPSVAATPETGGASSTAQGAGEGAEKQSALPNLAAAYEQALAAGAANHGHHTKVTIEPILKAGFAAGKVSSQIAFDTDSPLGSILGWKGKLGFAGKGTGRAAPRKAAEPA